MKKPLLAIILAAASALPIAVSAQQPPQGPPPEMRAQMEQIHTTARNNALNDLSADHRNRVQAIVNQVNAGTLDRRTAAQQIDAFLSPSESQAVLAEGQKMRESMRAMFQQQNGNMQPPNGDRMRGEGQAQGRQRRAPDAGRVLVMLASNHMRRPPMGQPPSGQP